MRKRILILGLCLAVLIALFAFGGSEGERTMVCSACHGAGENCSVCDGAGALVSGSNMAFTFWSLVPPIAAILLALLTKQVYLSLFFGIVLGGLFQSNFSPIRALDTVVNEGLIPAISDSAGIFLFLVILGILVVLMNKSGVSAAFGRWAETHIRSRVGVMLATFLLGMMIFVDDYFSCLTVGSVMRPLCDRRGISRAKLAYLIDASAAPICMIAPISSWAAAVSGVVEGQNGITLFVRAIPYNFYSLLTLLFVPCMILMRIDFGSMRLHEMRERLTARQEERQTVTRSKVIDLVLPVVVLITSCTAALVYVGGFFGTDAWGSTEFAGDFIRAFGNTDAFIALPWGSLIALGFTLLYYWVRGLIGFRDAMSCIPEGFVNMVPAITILTLATALKNMTGLLGARYFVAGLMDTAAGALYSLLPAIIFLTACLLSFSTGTSWGTFGILIPIVTYIFPADSTLFIIGTAACLAGAVFGDHCSPISDTTIMASAGAMCEHVDHVSTQLPYTVTVGAICFVNYLIAGFVQNALVCLCIGAVMVLGTLLVIRTRISRKNAA